MKVKKNIDDLFKDSFKNFEAVPSPDVWKNIQTKLKEEDDRKVIPIWVKFSGIAALLALFFTIGKSFLLNDSFNKTNTPVVYETNLEINKDLLDEKRIDITSPSNKTASSQENDHTESTNKSPLEVVSSSKTVISNNTNSKKGGISQNNLKDLNNKIAGSERNTQSKPSTNIVLNKGTIEKEISIGTISKTEIAVNNSNHSKEDDLIKENAEQDIIENKKSIFDAINEISDESTVIVANDSPDHRWELTPNVAPVYYNTLSEGSSIDPMFSDNSKNGDLNIAYGIKVSYNLNRRFSIRSGVSNVNLSYSTTGLELGTGPLSAASTTGIDYYERNNVTIVVDKGALAAQDSGNPFGNITPKSTNGETYLNQNISYYEMPLELNYAIINKKFGINLIGGFSTLILGNNEISIEAGDFNEVLGEASNLSSLSFTTNIGLGLNYSFSKKLMFIIEPMFKYQLNPYTDSSVDFQPYYIGVYSGLSFKF